ncbi:MAG: substrate-binding domain-containing protein [Oscillospiraceae bacterium]
MKKSISIFLSSILLATSFIGCSSNATQGNEDAFNAEKEISVISREDGSGTRGAFTELFDIIEKNDAGEKIDKTVETADITQSTGVMLTSVESNKYAIGYVSLGSINDNIKVLDIDNAKASTENIKNGNYKISRPFNIATMGQPNQQATDFINFIMSIEGQKVVEDAGYISKENIGNFKSAMPTGKISIAGSSSVAPVMEKLKEAYEKINGNLSIEISQSDSTNGLNSVADGICDIGMASRELKESELSKGISATAIALDGIAVIVNKSNTINNLSSETVKQIYTGKIAVWNEVE